MNKRKMSGLLSENVSPQVISRVGREIQELNKRPPDGIRYLPQDDDTIAEIHAEMEGPAGTPYEDGCFHVKLVLSTDFPHSPPRGFFLTKIYHPNVASNGDICVNTLKRDWKADVTISHVLQIVRCLLIYPFPESSLNDEAGKLFMTSYDEYARRARLWTSVHASQCSAAATGGDGTAHATATAGKCTEEHKDGDGSAAPTGTSAGAVVAKPRKGAAADRPPAAGGGKAAGAKERAKDTKKKGLKRL